MNAELERSEGPGALQAFTRDLRTSGSLAVPQTVQSQDWSYEESAQIHSIPLKTCTDLEIIGNSGYFFRSEGLSTLIPSDSE